jgi:hypothetical protein
MFTILGYGAGDAPFNKGVFMASTTDVGYASDIIEALARKHTDQWFGYFDVAAQSYSKPIRYILQEG